jgi:hypothetical protein
MTNQQFKCCTTGHSGNSAEAARLVLVEGFSVIEAAIKMKLNEQSVRNAMQRIKARYVLISNAGPWPKWNEAQKRIQDENHSA